jgi:hypothetical protein
MPNNLAEEYLAKVKALRESLGAQRFDAVDIDKLKRAGRP